MEKIQIENVEMIGDIIHFPYYWNVVPNLIKRYILNCSLKDNAIMHSDFIKLNCRRTPPVATSLLGRSRQTHWNSTQRPFCSSLLHRQMPGLVSAPPHSFMSFLLIMARTADRAQLRWQKMGGFWGHKILKKKLE
jgi:hypothetical protein